MLFGLLTYGLRKSYFVEQCLANHGKAFEIEGKDSRDLLKHNTTFFSKTCQAICP
jgi:hypothetical protein